jgi:hypothetical protein
VTLVDGDAALYERWAAGELYKRVLLRATHEGLAVVSPDAAADIRLQIELRPGRAVVRTRAGESLTVRLRGLGRDDAHLQVIQAAVQLLRQAVARMPRPEAVAQPAATPSHELWPPPAAVPRGDTPPAWTASVEVQTGVLHSAPHAGWVAGLRTAVPVGGPWALAVRGMVSQPFGLPAALSVTEGGAWGTLGISGALAPRFDWTAELGAGVWLHGYAYRTSRVVDEDGRRIEPSGLASLSGGWRAGLLRVGLAAGAVLTRRGRAHRRSDRDIWRAAPIRGMILLDLAVGRP